MSRTHDTRLDSWKAVAEFLHIDIRTARRWEKERALPVYRVPGGGRRAVHAYVSELEDWLRSDNQLRSDSYDPLQTQDQPAHGKMPSQSLANDKSGHAGESAGTGPRWMAKQWVFKFMSIALAGMVLLAVLAGFDSTRIGKVFAQIFTGFKSGESPTTRIESVSPIYAETTQTVVIRGLGFGSKPRTIRMDAASGGVDTFAGSNQTSLVITNLGEGSHRWTAGRASEVNSCEISVRLDEWSDSQIVISGFSGPFGSGCGEKYQITAGDRLEIGVFGPLNQCGPGGIPNCPEEVRNGHIGIFQTQVLPSATRDHPCR